MDTTPLPATAPAEVVFDIERDEATAFLVASWNDPSGGGITTQGADLKELQANVQDAVAAHFDELPERIRYHFLSDPVLAST